MAATTDAATVAAERELVITRVFDAPRRLVFKAWTDPKRMALWWGPDGFTNPFAKWRREWAAQSASICALRMAWSIR